MKRPKLLNQSSSFILLVLFISKITSENITTTPSDDSPTSILQFLQTEGGKFHFGTQKDIVLLLGNTGAGKSTLGLCLTDANLESIETIENSGVYRIVDKNNQISGLSATISHTVAPELMIDLSSGTSYYDCPGFSDSRGVAYDISVTYFIHNLLEHANKVKMVFVVSYSSVKHAIGDRHDFPNLARHVNTFIKDIGKYRNGIALVITKVENAYKKRQLIEDGKVIEVVATFLVQTKSDLQDKIFEGMPNKEKQLLTRQIKFIEILLETKNNKYTRIGILRQPDDNGPIIDMPLLQREKNYITSMVKNNIEYIPRNIDDFSYSLSAETMLRITELMDEMEIRLMAGVTNIGADIIEYFVKKEKSQTTKIDEMHAELIAGYQMLSNEKSPDPRLFLNQLVNETNTLGIPLSLPNVKNLHERDIDFFEFLLKVNPSKLSPSFDLGRCLINCTQYLVESQRWYSFLLSLRQAFYDQAKSSKLHDAVTSVMEQCSIEENQNKNIADLNLNPVLDNLNMKVSLEIENMRLSSFKLNSLKAVLNQILDESTFATCESNKLRMVGTNIRISEVITADCWSHATAIEIFALNKLIIDANIDKTGPRAQLSMIAPLWEIELNGNEVKRRIILDGEPQKQQKHPAENGKDGLPGKPGGSAGSFLGFALRFKKSQNLEISSVGGIGGNGQDGGRGTDGADEEVPLYQDCDINTLINSWNGNNFYHDKFVSAKCRFTILCISIIIHSKKCSPAGNGGNGGHGGFGGMKGKVLIVGLEVEHSTVIVKNGDKGMNGKGGNGGSGGKKTEIELEGGLIRAFIFPNDYIFNVKNVKVDTLPAGRSGVDGYNTIGMENPKSVELPNITQAINNYRDYVERKLNNNARASYLTEFMRAIERYEKIQY